MIDFIVILIRVLFSGNIISIAYFNFSGISVAKEISATTRMVLDSVRTFFIWTFSLAVGWQTFNPLQVLFYYFNHYCYTTLKIFEISSSLINNKNINI